MNMIIGSNSEEIAAMIEAFDKACQTLHDGGQPDVIIGTVAKRIIEAAEVG
jgi:hypothetical protein